MSIEFNNLYEIEQLQQITKEKHYLITVHSKGDPFGKSEILVKRNSRKELLEELKSNGLILDKIKKV